jgi:beta-xylosidase
MKHNILITTLFTATLVVLHAAEPATKPAWGDQGDGTYRNPILWADYNNPCVFKTGDTFYLTCASHHFMGMPLLASKDLVNWTHAGRIYSHLGGVHADFTFPGKACSAGSQDGEVGFFRGTYYMFNWSTRMMSCSALLCNVHATAENGRGGVCLASERLLGEQEVTLCLQRA